MNKLIAEATSKHLVITFDYEGGRRKVEPHTYGIHKTTGNEVLRGYQVSGFSNSSAPEEWKLFLITNITNLSVTSEVFKSTRNGYNPKDRQMSEIYASA